MNLLKPREVDLLFRYPAGRALRLAKAGRIPFVKLPDGELRFDEEVIRKILRGQDTTERHLKPTILGLGAA